MSFPFSNLRANGRLAPLGVASKTTRLTWVATQNTGASDAVCVALSDDLDALLERGEQTIRTITLSRDARSVVINTPEDRTTFWRVGHLHGDYTMWSSPTSFTTAPDLIESGAQWVTHPDLASKGPRNSAGSVWFALEIFTDPLDRSTLLHFATPGVVDVRVDGFSTSGIILGPGYSDLGSEASAVTHDLGHLASGPHTITIEIASGPYWITATPDRYTKFQSHSQAPSLLAMVEQLGANTRTTVTRANQTRTGIGATVATHWYGGEDFDAGLPEPWQAQDLIRAVDSPHPHPEIWWPEHPPLSVVDTFEKLSSHPVVQGVLADFGHNMAGVPEVRWGRSPADRVVKIFPAEQASPAGVDQDSTGSPIFDQLWIPAGTEGSWMPRFTYHGFRYLEIRGAQDVDVRAHVVRATNERSGQFASTDPLLDRLHIVIDRAVQSNMFSVFTDCPHREKLGWIEQLHFCFDALVRNFNVEAHLRDMLHHMRRAQLPSGAIPNIVPEFVDFSGHGFQGDVDAFRFDVNWGAAILHLPLKHYRQYGDVRVLVDNLPAIKCYLAYLRDRESGNLIDFGLGDWIALDMWAPRELVASHGYLRALAAAASIADIVRDEHWALESRERAAAVLRELQRYVASPDSTQTELAIQLDLAERRGDVIGADIAFRYLIDRIAEDGGAFTVGEVTLELLIDALHRRGASELIYRTISREDVPGYGMQLARGVTALAETWSAERLDVGEGSHNHFMLGMIDHWMQGDVAGLRQSPGSVGWNTAVVAPTFLRDVPAASTVHDSPIGMYGVSWRRVDSGLVAVEVTVPPDGSAQIRIPGLSVHDVGAGLHSYSVGAGPTNTEENQVKAHD